MPKRVNKIGGYWWLALVREAKDVARERNSKGNYMFRQSQRKPYSLPISNEHKTQAWGTRYISIEFNIFIKFRLKIETRTVMVMMTSESHTNVCCVAGKPKLRPEHQVRSRAQVAIEALHSYKTVTHPSSDRGKSCLTSMIDWSEQ